MECFANASIDSADIVVEHCVNAAEKYVLLRKSRSVNNRKNLDTAIGVAAAENEQCLYLSTPNTGWLVRDKDGLACNKWEFTRLAIQLALSHMLQAKETEISSCFRGAVQSLHQ